MVILRAEGLARVPVFFETIQAVETNWRPTSPKEVEIKQKWLANYRQMLNNEDKDPAKKLGGQEWTFWWKQAYDQRTPILNQLTIIASTCNNSTGLVGAATGFPGNLERKGKHIIIDE
jgi:hypothetical protein